MERRDFLKTSGLTISSLAIFGSEIAMGNLLENPFKTQELRRGVGVFTEKGGTIAYLINKKGILVVDAQFPEQSTHLINELKSKTERPFKYLINTHHHGDHTSGNISFKGMVGQVIAHENSLKNQTIVAIAAKNEDKQLFPTITFADTWKVKMGNEIIKAHYFGSAHTDGDALIHFEHANVLHMGDLMFHKRYPAIDTASGASVKNWINVLDKTLATFDNETQFIFGHAFENEPIIGGKEEIKLFQDYLHRLLEFAGNEIKAGKTKEEILANKTLPNETLMKGDGILRGLTAAYNEQLLK